MISYFNMAQYKYVLIKVVIEALLFFFKSICFRGYHVVDHGLLFSKSFE